MRLFAAWLMAMLALISSAVAEIPYLDYEIDFQAQGNQFHVQSKVRNTPLLRFLPKLTTNAFAGAGYTYVFRFAKNDSADAMSSITGAWNAANGKIEFYVTTNSFARPVVSWYATVVAMSGTVAVSYAPGLITIGRSPEIDTPGVLATLTAINGSGYGPFTGSFVGWPFPVESGSISQFTGETTSAGLVWQSTTNGWGRWGPAVTATGAVSEVIATNGITGGGAGAVTIQIDTNFIKQLAGVTNEPLFDASPALGITSNNILQWNAAISTNTTGTISSTTILDGTIATNDLDTNVNGRIAKGVEAWGWGPWSSATFNAASDFYGAIPNGNIRSNAVELTMLESSVTQTLGEASAAYAWGSWSQGIYGASSDLYRHTNGTPNLRSNVVTTVEILDATVAAADMATNVGVSTFLNDSGYLTTSAAQVVFFPTNGALGGDLYGTPTNALIRTNAIGSAEVTDGTLSTSDVVLSEFDGRYLTQQTGIFQTNIHVNSSSGGRIYLRPPTQGSLGTGYVEGTYFATTGSSTGIRISGDIISLESSNGYWFAQSGSVYHTIWHSGNDGSGSLLDADLLDGNDSTSFANKTMFDAASNNMVRLASTGTQVIATGVSIYSNTTISAPLVMIGNTNLVNSDQLSNGNFTNFSLWSCDTCAHSTSDFLVVYPPSLTSTMTYTGTTTWVKGQQVRIGVTYINYTASDELRIALGDHSTTNVGVAAGTNRITVTLPTHATNRLTISVVTGTNFAYIDNVTCMVVNATGQTLSVAGDVDAGGNITAAGTIAAAAFSGTSTSFVEIAGDTMTGALMISNNLVSGNGHTVLGGGLGIALVGGVSNSSGDDFSFVGGGELNNAEANNVGIMGGYLNNINGDYGAIVAGKYNSVGGENAVTIGGRSNIANGADAFAAGVDAVAGYTRSFVWSDGMTNDFGSTASNQFAVHASGGIRLAGGPIYGDASGLTNLPASATTAGVDSITGTGAVSGVLIFNEGPGVDLTQTNKVFNWSVDGSELTGINGAGVTGPIALASLVNVVQTGQVNQATNLPLAAAVLVLATSDGGTTTFYKADASGTIAFTNAPLAAAAMVVASTDGGTNLFLKTESAGGSGATQAIATVGSSTVTSTISGATLSWSNAATAGGSGGYTAIPTNPHGFRVMYVFNSATNFSTFEGTKLILMTNAANVVYDTGIADGFGRPYWNTTNSTWSSPKGKSRVTHFADAQQGAVLIEGIGWNDSRTATNAFGANPAFEDKFAVWNILAPGALYGGIRGPYSRIWESPGATNTYYIFGRCASACYNLYGSDLTVEILTVEP